MQYLIPFYIFFIGLCIGSFLNVVIYRIPKSDDEKSDFFSKSRSYCPHCKNQLAWYHNIPLISYIFLKGSCAFCKKHISLQYPFIELSNAILYLLVYYKFGLNIPTLLFYFFVMSSFLVMSYIDFKYQIVHDIISLSTIALAIFIANNTLLPYSFDVVKQNFLIFVTFIGTIYFLKNIFENLCSKELLGEGDIYIIGLIAILFGNTIFNVFFILFIASVICLCAMIILKYFYEDIVYIGFIPYLFIAMILANIILNVHLLNIIDFAKIINIFN